jgi:hypothetical protein
LPRTPCSEGLTSAPSRGSMTNGRWHVADVGRLGGALKRISDLRFQISEMARGSVSGRVSVGRLAEVDVARWTAAQRISNRLGGMGMMGGMRR